LKLSGKGAEGIHTRVVQISLGVSQIFSLVRIGSRGLFEESSAGWEMQEYC